MSNRYILVIGDMLTIFVITVVGFGTHAEVGLSYLPRIAETFFPVSVAWFILAPWFGLYHNETVVNARQLWRPAFVMIFVGPLAALMRGFLLDSPVIPIFGLVLSITNALGVIFWRTLFFFLRRRAG
jgi:hypothetical protein